jgi:mevalonate kinase
MASPTARAVARVRLAFEADPERLGSIFNSIGAICRAARLAISRGDMPRLGELMEANQELLVSLEVSTSELDQLVAAARSAGAWGAKLSGGGLGGNVIALLPDADHGEVAAALLAAGAVRCLTTQVEPT